MFTGPTKINEKFLFAGFRRIPQNSPSLIIQTKRFSLGSGKEVGA